MNEFKNEFEIVNFFSLCVIDISKLSGINLREFLELGDTPEYYLIISPSPLPIDYIIQNIPENYRVQAIVGRFYIASQIGSSKHYIPEADYILVNVKNKISGIILHIRDIRILYINIEGYSDQERQEIYSIIERLCLPQHNIHMVCLESNKINNGLRLKNWTYHLTRKEYCLSYPISFHALVNNNDSMFKTKPCIFTQDCSTQDGNIGTTIHIPYIDDMILNFLNRCLSRKINPFS